MKTQDHSGFALNYVGERNELFDGFAQTHITTRRINTRTLAQTVHSNNHPYYHN
jgi:hypothetical protein